MAFTAPMQPSSLDRYLAPGPRGPLPHALLPYLPTLISASYQQNVTKLTFIRVFTSQDIFDEKRCVASVVSRVPVTHQNCKYAA